MVRSTTPRISRMKSRSNERRSHAAIEIDPHQDDNDVRPTFPSFDLSASASACC
jgi:hypothetical protein